MVFFMEVVVFSFGVSEKGAFFMRYKMHYILHIFNALFSIHIATYHVNRVHIYTLSKLRCNLNIFYWNWHRQSSQCYPRKLKLLQTLFWQIFVLFFLLTLKKSKEYLLVKLTHFQRILTRIAPRNARLIVVHWSNFHIFAVKAISSLLSRVECIFCKKVFLYVRL